MTIQLGIGGTGGTFGKRMVWRMLASGGAMALILGSQPVRAQVVASAVAPTPTKPEAAASATPEADLNNGEVVITGSRIVRDGYSAPTPVSVISTEEISREAPASISDFVNTLPAVRGSTTAANSNGSLSNGQAGIATVNLRSLGSNRTLVLVDGQRSVPSATNGVVDTNTIPQALIQRVEVVTGGASSAYGSDAISGVINFILDKEYKGIKAEYQYGVTTYGDGSNNKFNLTAGTGFGEGRGHVIVSGEYFKQKEITTIDRAWNNTGFFQIDNPAYSAAACTDSNPATLCVNARLIQPGIGTGIFAPGGLIINSSLNPASLRGTYFGTINPATGKAVTGTALIPTTAQSGQWLVGNDYKYLSSGHVGTASLLPSETRRNVFGRVSWSFAPWLNVFAQGSYAYYGGTSFYQHTFTPAPTSLTAANTTPTTSIKVDNAFLPDNIRAALVAANATSIAVGFGNDGIPPQGSNNKREVYRYVVGTDGAFAALNREWKWNAYYQRGVTKTDELLTNAWNYVRLNNATDAVVAAAGNVGGYAAGSIVCRVNVDAITTNDDRACVPINRLGIGGVTKEALDYILYNGRQPERFQRLTQDVAAINFSTNNLFEIWAGPVSIAFGGEYRKETVKGTVDPLFAPSIVNGVTTPGWIYGNYVATNGSYDVKEGFAETVIPIIKNMDFNGAVRVTSYSTSGLVTTWKAGLTWQPIEDIKFRGTISRDIRAPNLGELYSPGAGATNAVTVPNAAGVLISDQYINSQVGNTALVPEVAKTYGVGAVFTPSFFSGFAASVDYYKIDIKGAIASLSAQTIADQCYLQGNKDSCSFISTAGGRGVTTPGLDIISIDIKPLNFVGVQQEGIDFEASYRREVGPGAVQLRALANYAIKYVTNNGIDPAHDSAGENSGLGGFNLPKWTYRVSAAYNLQNGLSVEAVGRGISGGKYDNSYIVCTTTCPTSTVANRTVNVNSIAGQWNLDLNADYKFVVRGVKADAFLSIRNVLNSDPVLVANGPTGNNTPAYPETNRALYDVLGRVFRLGMRVAY